MNLIVGIQVYQQKGPGSKRPDDCPLVLAESSVEWVALDPGETQTVDELAQLAIQIHVGMARKSLGWTITEETGADGKTIFRKTVTKKGGAGAKEGK